MSKLLIAFILAATLVFSLNLEAKKNERVKYYIQTSPAVVIGDSGVNSLTNVGNKICPVTGKPVNGIDYVVFHGKKYGFHSERAAKKFLKDPDRYLDK